MWTLLRLILTIGTVVFLLGVAFLSYELVAFVSGFATQWRASRRLRSLRRSGPPLSGPPDYHGS